MKEAKQGKPRNLIPKPVSQAFLAGASIGTISLALSLKGNVSGDQAFQSAAILFLAGAGLSLGFSWNDSRLETKPKKRNRGRSIPFSHAQGSQKIDMEFSVSQGGYVTRKTNLDTLKSLFGSKQARQSTRAIQPVDKPGILNEFYFVSQGIQLQKVHVQLFLKSAWRNRFNGKGLSARRWVRNFSQRPAWYKELSPTWYYAVRALLVEAELFTGRQLIITLGNQQSFLALEPYHIFRILKWYEWEKNK